MKKIFTLIGVALMAMSANAQDVYKAIVKSQDGEGKVVYELAPEFKAVVGEGNVVKAENLTGNNSTVKIEKTNITVEAVASATPKDCTAEGVSTWNEVKWESKNQGDIDFSYILGTGIAYTSWQIETMYEDDGTSMNYKKQQLVTTEYNVAWDENGAIEINIGKAEGILSLIPGERKYEIRIYGVDLVKDKFAVSVCGKEVLQDDQDICFKYDDKRSILTVTLSKVISECGLELSVSGLEPGKNAYKEQVTDLLKRAWSDNCEKDAVFNALNSLGHDDFLNWLKEDNCSELLKDAVTELCM